MKHCNNLQSRSQIAEQNLSESKNLVSFLRFRVEQLETTESRQHRGMAETTIVQTEEQQQFHQQPQTSSTMVNDFGPPTKSGLSTNNLDTLFAKQMRLNDSISSSSFVSDNNLNSSQLVTLAESVLNEKGPLPVGEVGKMLQEATGNSNLSQILKERHNGLKKFLEKYSDKFIMSCDHPFNPHVYLRRSYSSDDQRMIESGSTAFLDKKTKKTRRKDKKTWPNTVPPSPTIGSNQTTRVFSA